MPNTHGKDHIMKISHILAASALSLALVAPAFAQDAAPAAAPTADSAMTAKPTKAKKTHAPKAKKMKMKKGETMKTDAMAPAAK